MRMKDGGVRSVYPSLEREWETYGSWGRIPYFVRFGQNFWVGKIFEKSDRLRKKSKKDSQG